MKLYRLVAVLLIVIMLAIALPSGAIADSGASSNDTNALIPAKINGIAVPSQIAGYKVIFVEWSENSPYMQPGGVVLTLQAKSNDPKVSGYDQALNDAATKLPQGWTISVVGGPNLSLDGLLANHQALNDFWGEGGRFGRSGGPLPDVSASTNTQTLVATALPTDNTPRSVCLDQNEDAGSKTLMEQDVTLRAPNIGFYHNASSFDMQVQTNTDHFLQAGLTFKYLQGANYAFVQWTADIVPGDNPYYWQPFSPVLNYTPYHYYALGIYYNGTNWVIQAVDTTTGGYAQKVVTWITGTKLKYSHNTSVWFENQNTNANWYQGIQNPIQASNADEEVANVVYRWSSDSKWEYTVNSAGTVTWLYYGNIFSGGLANGGTCGWNLANIPLAPTS